MKKTIRILIVILGFITVYGCKTKDANNDVSVIYPYDNQVNDIAKAETSNYFKNRKIVRLETKKESLISEINRLIIFDNKFYVFDQRAKSIFVFDEYGKFEFKIARIGKGPGEYVQLTDFTIDYENKNIVLLCDIPNCLIYLTLEGEFIKQEKKEILDHYISFNNNSLYFASFPTNKRKHHISIKHNNKLKEFLPIEKYYSEKAFFGIHANIIRSDSVFYFKAYDNIIYQLKNDNVVPKYKIDFGDKALDISVVIEKNQDDLINYCIEEKLICQISEFRENQKYITFTTWPYRNIIMHNKLNNTTHRISGFYDPEIGVPFTHHIAHDGAGENMIFIVEATNLVNYMKVQKKKVKDIDNSAIYEIADVTENDNPILFLYDFK